MSHRRIAIALVLVPLLAGCHPLDRNNPVDPAGQDASGGGESSALSLVVPLPKPLTTVVDRLVARLEGPDMQPVTKLLKFDSPAGPAVLTIGAIAPGSGRTLTIEGYDESGRLILTGRQTDIAIVAGDTTRVSLDLRLAVAANDLEAPADTSAAGKAGGDPTAARSPSWPPSSP